MLKELFNCYLMLISTDVFYLVTRQRVQTRILFDVSSSDIEASTVKGTSHSVSNQRSWFIMKNTQLTLLKCRRYVFSFGCMETDGLPLTRGAL